MRRVVILIALIALDVWLIAGSSRTGRTIGPASLTSTVSAQEVCCAPGTGKYPHYAWSGGQCVLVLSCGFDECTPFGCDPIQELQCIDIGWIWTRILALVILRTATPTKGIYAFQRAAFGTTSTAPAITRVTQSSDSNAFRQAAVGTKTPVPVLTLVTRSRDSNAFRRDACGTTSPARVLVLWGAILGPQCWSAGHPIPPFGAWIVGWRRCARPKPSITCNTARTAASTTVGA